MTDAPASTPAVVGAPRRPWTAWAALVLFFGAVGGDVAALLTSMWLAVRQFESSSVLAALVHIELGDPLRVPLVAAVWAASVAIGVAASIAGYYGWQGYLWPRWAGIVAVVVGGLSLICFYLAPLLLVPLALGAIALWLPATRRYARAMDAVRHPAVVYPIVQESVLYGPLPRYGQ